MTVTGIGKPPAVAEGAQDGPGAAAVTGAVGPVESRADAARAIESIIGYYSKHEPGSPIPLVLERAKAWIDMDFLSILNDINPTGAEDAKNILSRREGK